MKYTQLRIDEELDQKVKYISQKQERSWNAQIIWIVKQYVADYEKINGQIKLNDDIERSK